MNINHFQTPIWVCDIMTTLIDSPAQTILEPTPGHGNLVYSLRRHYPYSDIRLGSDIFIHNISAPRDFMLVEPYPVDWVVANPPFTPMSLCYRMLERFFQFSPNVIALMPWLTIINSEARTNQLCHRGLRLIIHLPRRAFPGSRVQTCILKFIEGYKGPVILRFNSCSPSS